MNLNPLFALAAWAATMLLMFKALSAESTEARNRALPQPRLEPARARQPSARALSKNARSRGA